MKYSKRFMVAALAMGIAACVGDKETDQDSASSDTPAETPMVRMGLHDGVTFTEGVLGASANTVEVGQSVDLTAFFVDPEDDYYTSGLSVVFNSRCLAEGLATLDDEEVTSANGVARVEYTNVNCVGEDDITAKASEGEISLEAVTTLFAVEKPVPPLSSISFESAEPGIIGIRGTGAIPEQSTVSFKLVDIEGDPVVDAEVEFELNNTVGGVTLTRDTVLTDEAGIASTGVLAGSQATTVRVTATAYLSGVQVSAPSSALAVTTGLPDQDSFSLSSDTLNVEGWAYDGQESEIIVRAADHFNNPVPDGTAVSFSAEGGSIGGACITEDGACSVTLITQSPRPSNGRVTVLATAIGQESYIDTNPANGRYDDGEIFWDLPEAFRDDNENGTWDPHEPYVNFDSPIGTEGYDDADGLYSGILCNGPLKCASNNSVTVFSMIEIVFSGSSFNISSTHPTLVLNEGDGPIDVGIVIADSQGQRPPKDTTINISTTAGTIVGRSSHTVKNDNQDGPLIIPVKIQADGNGSTSADADSSAPDTAEDNNGIMVVDVLTPLGNESTQTFQVIQP